MAKIVLIEDHIMLRDMMKENIERATNHTIVGVSSDAKDSIKLCESLNPDLVLMDICTENDSSGIVYGGKIKDKFPNIKVILMTGVPEINFVNKSKENNIDGFIYKNISKENLINTIEQVLGGYSIFPKGASVKKDSTFLEDLTEKELKILTLYCEGAEREEIAEILQISSGTLKNHISSILKKTDFPNMPKLSIYCVANDYIVPNLKE